MELDNWQTTLGSCKDKLSYILDTAMLSDVTFVIGEEREIIKAHSFILRLNSPVFDVMLSGRWDTQIISEPLDNQLVTTAALGNNSSSTTSEESGSSSTPFASTSQAHKNKPWKTNDNDSNFQPCNTCKRQSYVPRRFRHHPYQDNGASGSGDKNSNSTGFVFPHLEPLPFRFFLKYIYTDEFNFPLEYAMGVWHLGEYYSVPQLTEKCETFVMDSLDKDNALMIYQEARLVHQDKIADIALQYVLFHAREIFASEDFVHLRIESLISLLKNDGLHIEEASLFPRVYAWGEAECSRQELELSPQNIRLVLGEAFSLIRFPIIPPHRFTIDVVPKDLLKDFELISLYKYITLLPAERDSAVIDLGEFSRVPRRPVTHLSRYNPKQTPHARLGHYGPEVKRLSFSIDHKISLSGIGIFAASPPSDQEKYEIVIELKDHEDANVISSVEKTIKPRKLEHSIVPILFPSPVLLEEGLYYIHYKVAGPITFYTTGHCSKELTVKRGTESVTFSFTTSDSKDELGQVGIGIPIPEIYFVL